MTFSPDATAGSWTQTSEVRRVQRRTLKTLAMAQIRLVLDALLDASPLRVVERRAARGVLIPSYARLVVARA